MHFCNLSIIRAFISHCSSSGTCQARQCSQTVDLFTVCFFCAMTTDLRHFLQHPLTTDLHVVTLLRVMMSLVVIVPSTVVPSRSTTHMSIATSCSYYSWDFCISVVITTSSFWLNSLYWSVLSYPWSFLSKCVLVIVKDCTHTIDFYCETLCRQTSCLLVHNMYIVCAVIFPCCNYQSSLYKLTLFWLWQS